MKKAYKIAAAVFLAVFMAAIFVGCSLLPSRQNPKSVEVDGETYVSGFYGDDLYVVGVAYRAAETAEFETKYHNWWQVENAPFAMYCAQNKEAQNWTPALYCKESEFETVKAYYASVKNYSYYIGGWEEGQPQIELAESDGTEYAERAIRFKSELHSGVFSPYNDRLVTFGVADFDWYRAVIYRTSADGIFTTTRSEWAICKGALYISHSYDDEKQEGTFYSTDQDVSDHMVALFGRYGLIEA